MKPHGMEFFEDRRGALLTQDEEAIARFNRKYGMTWPEDEGAFWERVHQMRAWPLVDLPEAEREKSQLYLDRLASDRGCPDGWDAYIATLERDRKRAARRARKELRGAELKAQAEGDATGTRKERFMDSKKFWADRSRYLKADSLVQPLRLTIARVEMEEVGLGNDREDKMVVYFESCDQGLILNRTNTQSITEIVDSDETDSWVGRRVELFNDKSVKFQGNRGAIRIRAAEEPPSAGKAPI